MSLVANKIADVIKIEGTAEGELAKVLAQRRLYEYLLAKLDVIKGMGSNKHLKIFGNSSDSNLA